MKHVRQWAAALALVAVACGRTGAPVEPEVEPQHVQAGDTVTLRYGASARLDDTVRIVFRAVESDSRCPIDVQCVWAGDAVIHIDVARGTGSWQRLVLHTNTAATSGTVGGYVIELVGVEPPRRQQVELEPADYSVRLAISRG